MKIHRNYTVKGKVQGVFFRASTKSMAEDLAICGLVKNMSDGTVYIEAEGSSDQLGQFEQWLQEGPRFARVDSITRSESEQLNYRSFEITY